ncbi:alpha/beta hydrolase [Flavobacterium noncentrifugens]|uniref:Alpha/beta hydrolase family protein n=1 Tax=Flavobacterium noncentrifugens TaxID=1128970 RepID=A0A1G8VGF1_9FLAO|nr:alpha/beta fold hydrolase [Flavobacterium noncentrifugens]GEP50467.1 alpha/beta hydrolase [Flavobacterium noncentrifugens]SDJ64395.1 Alpha/beta hydrolase family protein [Flavobacterium noncentrifugens]
MRKLKYFLLTKSIGLYINFLSYTHPKKATLLAYKLFSNPREGRLSKENLPEILKETEHKTLAFEGQQFHSYTWKGNDHIILLIHGWESNASRWEKMLPYLQKSGSTIVAIDGPAHGLSSGLEFNVPTYAAFIDVAAKKFQPHTIIGHSIGGAASVYYQYKYQNIKLQKMVLLGTPSDLRTLIANYVALLSLNSKMETLLDDYFLQKFQFQLDAFSGKIFGEKLNLKGIIAHDLDDTIVAFGESQKIASGWKNATFIETKGLGHSMHDDVLYNQVIKFLFED